MGFIRRKIICFSCLLLISIIPLFPKSICILVDMSGSMRNYGDWTSEARTALQEIFNTGNINRERWSLTGGQFEKLRGLRLNSNDVIHFLKFGSIQSSSEFPYFSNPKKKIFNASLSISSFLQSNFPSISELRDLRTNKSLARAVGAYLLDCNSKPWYLIVISDFLQDADMSREQRDFVDRIETCFLFNDLIAFCWNENDNIRLRITEVKKESKCSNEQKPECKDGKKIIISLSNPGHKSEYKAGKQITFQWKPKGAEGNINYGLYINYKKNNKRIFGTSNIKRTSYSVSSKMTKKWKSGEYIWRITAKRGNDIIGKSSSRIFKINAVPPIPLILLYLLILIVLFIGGYTVYKKIKAPAMEEEEE